METLKKNRRFGVLLPVAAVLAGLCLGSSNLVHAQWDRVVSDGTGSMATQPDAVSPAFGSLEQADGKRRLVVQGADTQHPLRVFASRGEFADWDDLFAHMERNLGATIIRDRRGRAIGATGEVALSGHVVFEEPAGTQFVSADLVAGYLGGRDGLVQVGEQRIAVRGTPEAALRTGDTGVSYLNDRDSICDGEDCVSGHSWVSHFLFWHSVGAWTKQTSGGTRTVWVPYCTSGTLVRPNGTPKCRGRGEGGWVFDPELRVWIQLPGGGYTYADPRWRRTEVFSNELTVSARLLPSVFPDDYALKTEYNTDKVELSSYTVIRDVLNQYGQEYPIPLADVSGICAGHSSSAGGSLQTADGSTGDDDSACTGPQWP